MACDDLPDDLKILWKEAGTGRPMFSPEQLRQESEKMQVRRRRDYFVVGVVFTFAAVGYALFFFYFYNNILTRVGAVLSAVIFGYLVIHILRERARARPDSGDTDGLRFYRTELERRRDWHRWVVWRSPILAPPLILFDLGFAQIFSKYGAFVAPMIWSGCLFILVVLGILTPMKHLAAARKYQDRIDALNGFIRS
jgi:hypothetical protein